MSSDCKEEDLPCSYCGEPCFGRCADPDTCPHCWLSEYDVYEVGDNSEEECRESKCRCNCHPWNEDYCFGWFESEEDPYEREGIFQFLALPGETREKIYGYAFLQSGNQRTSANHRGFIHTALLGTCRQVYKEARHLPLTLNRLCFPGPLEAHDFLGFTLAPTVRSLFTGLDTEFHYREKQWPYLLRQLAKMLIMHLGLTVKGGYPAESIQGHTCFINRFTVLKSLKSFNLRLASHQVSAEVNTEIEEELRAILIKDYVGNGVRQMKGKDVKAKYFPMEGEINRVIESIEKSNRSPIQSKMPFKSRKLSNHCRQRALRACTTSAEAKAQSKQSMLSTCELLDAYATSLDPEATSVKIRFANANKAAEDVDKKMFSKLTLSIWETLEEQFSRIYAARAKLSSFAQVSILENNAKDEPVQPYAPAESLRERQATQDLQNGLNVLMHVDDVNVPNTIVVSSLSRLLRNVKISTPACLDQPWQHSAS